MMRAVCNQSKKRDAARAQLFSWFADETALFHAKKQKGAAINGALQKRFSLMLFCCYRALEVRATSVYL
jgi:hypothetical protein